MIHFNTKTALATLAVTCGLLAFMGTSAVAGGPCCPDPCCQPCCPPPPVLTELCVQDPCTCCTYKVCVCLPACCVEDPCVTCRPGIFGRKILTYTWPCCGHSIDVVITKRGRTIVRG
jgi:hypothetical protein